MSSVYRFKQGTRALTAFARPVDEAIVEQVLSPELAILFRSMRRSEQLHSLRVLHALLAEGEVPPSLAIAALLHDCGKARYPLSLWQRSLPVVVSALSERHVVRWSAGDPNRRMMRGFVVYAHHPAWSASLLREHGAPEDAVWLAAHHADDLALWTAHPLFPLLRRLQYADNTN